METAEAKTLTPTLGCKSSELKQGDRLSETQYYEVLSVDKQLVHVKNERGLSFSISRRIVEEGMYTANQFSEERKVSQTELASILENARDEVFSINFNMKPKTDEVLQQLQSVNKKDLTEKMVKEMIAGKVRTLVGYRANTEQSLGRTTVIDLQASESPKGRFRLVDHRTINWIIIKNVKYSLVRARR